MNEINILYKKSKGRNVRIQISTNGLVTVFKPVWTPLFIVNNFLKKKKDWIEKKVEEQKKKTENATHFPSKKNKRETRKEYLVHKEIARGQVSQLLSEYKDIYKKDFNLDFTWNKVAIKNTSTRFGSCSSRKNLNFSYKIIFMNDAEKKYLIVHELCHLLQMNHSHKFWALVELAIPDYKQVRKNMKKFNLG